MGYTATYWIVKNSWGASWGDKGYVHIGRSEGEGVCGINMDAVQPEVKPGNAPPLPAPTPGPKPGLPCNCTASCEAMCRQFGMICCGNGHDCDCSSESSCPKCNPNSVEAIFR